MRMALSIVALIAVLGCSRSREEEFHTLFRRQLLSLGKDSAQCRVDGLTLREMLSGFVERMPVSAIEMPFVCFARMEGESGSRPVLHEGSSPSPELTVRWNGVFDQDAMGNRYRGEQNFCFTVFLVTSNDLVRVISFERFRNGGRYGGPDGRHFRGCDGNMELAIWDGIMPDRNHPEELFREPFKDVFAVLTERPFNYCYYTSRDRLTSAWDSLSRQRRYRVVDRTEASMTFVSEAVLSGDGVK